ncbi:MAG: hypothetical protein KJ044_14165 [Planctomycetes bacterium]|nr:hypothetical protein [Planctomycetota bacterium]
MQYISPEQARGMADLDIRADIYSLGATLYHMVIGELPFTGKDSMEVMAKQVMEGLNQHTLKGGKISVHMHYFIEKMMSKERDFRYQTAREVVDDVTEVLQGAADLQYNPENDPTSPFMLGNPSSTQRLAGHSTGKFAPVRNSSTRMAPVGGPAGSVRKPPVTGAGSNTSSIRKPPIKPGTSVRLPNAGTSVRLPGAPPTNPGQKSVRLPTPRKPGDTG